MISSVLLLSAITLVRAAQPPLQSNDNRIDRYEGSECVFGEKFRELGSSWFLDLGPPIGVKYCIKCQCVPIPTKKNKIVAKVTCRNLELECPKITCTNPVQLPEACCKVCLDDFEASEIQNTEPINESENLADKDYFVTLLSSQSSRKFSQRETVRNPKLKQNNIATGRFVFHGRNLYYSFYSTSRPQKVQFTDLIGNILEEKVMTKGSEYQNATGKICGVWKRVSRNFQKMLHEEKILVSLVWDQNTDVLIGQLRRMNSHSEELFSSLLESEEGDVNKGAGTAIMSLQPNSATLHVTILFNGVFAPQDLTSMNVSVKIENALNNHVFMNKVLRVKKPSNELNILEFNAVLPPPFLNALSNQEISLSVLSKLSSLRLTGKILQSVTCEIYQTLLTSRSSGHSMLKPANISGLSWIFLDQRNELHYHIQLKGTNNVTAVSLASVQKGVTVKNLRPAFKNGWINGTVSRLTPLQLNMLKKGELGISVESPSKTNLIQGKLTGRFMDEMVDVSGPSLLTKRNSTDKSLNLTGLIWAGFDTECTLLYEVLLDGVVPENMSLQLHMEDIPLIVEGAPVKTTLLKEFTGSFIDGVSVGLTNQEMARISAHFVAFVILDAISGATILRGSWNHLPVPDSCLPQSGSSLALLYHGNDDAQANDIEGYDVCYHGSKYYEEGSQWESSLEPCKMCHCQKSQVECTAYICPPVTCQYPVKRPGECCPTCLRSFHKQALAAPSRRCVLGNQKYLPGSSWYPYLPPNGFDTCAVCTCNAITLEVRCPRLKCPPLECDEKTAIRPSKTACCKVCPLSKPRTESPEEIAMMHDEALAEHDKEAEIIAKGGCKYPLGKLYENGEEWHPQVFKQGAFKCVICSCKDGTVKCARKKCTKAMCDDECCTTYCQKMMK